MPWIYVVAGLSRLRPAGARGSAPWDNLEQGAHADRHANYRPARDRSTTSSSRARNSSKQQRTKALQTTPTRAVLRPGCGAVWTSKSGCRFVGFGRRRPASHARSRAPARKREIRGHAAGATSGAGTRRWSAVARAAGSGSAVDSAAGGRREGGWVRRQAALAVPQCGGSGPDAQTGRRSRSRRVTPDHRAAWATAGPTKSSFFLRRKKEE
jgi:hypothetical protein